MSFTDKELLEARAAVERYCIKLTGSRHIGEDLCQTTLLKALEHRERYIPQKEIKAWLFTIARNLHYSSHRKNGRMDIIDPHVLEATSDAGPSDAPMHIIDLKRMLATIKRLPESFSGCLSLAIEGYDYQEAADILGIKIGTYKSRLSRARDALEKSLEAPHKVIRTRPVATKPKEIDAAVISPPEIPPAPPIKKRIEIQSVMAPPAPRIFDEAELSIRLQISRSKIHAALVESGRTLPVNPVFNTSAQSYMVSVCNMAELCSLFRIPTRNEHPSYMTPSDASMETGIEENVLRTYFDGLVRQKKKYGYATIGGKAAVSIVQAYDERKEAVVPMIPMVFSPTLAKAIS